MPVPHPLKTSQRLCDPSWFLGKFHGGGSNVTNELTVDSLQCHSLRHADEEEFMQLISSSFHKVVRTALPYLNELTGAPCTPGGIWFWETYRHGLFGENVVVYLGGTALSLTEDCLASQAALRVKACAEYIPSSVRSRNLLAHGSAKLEIVFALALSVALHVTKLPVLERAQGPRAIIMCATHSQCAEFAAVLEHFCPSLHLVVHNLFEGYPSLPADKRADVVVGTPPLWEAVSQFERRSSTVNVDIAARLGGLEDLLIDLEGDGQLPPAYDLSRWRPYNLMYVEQLVLFDLELQVNMGFEAILQHVILDTAAPSRPCTVNNAGRQKGKLPLSCQQYVVIGGDRWRIDQDAVDHILKVVESRGAAFANNGTAKIELSNPTLLCSEKSLRKRPRDSNVSEEQKPSIRRTSNYGVTQSEEVPVVESEAAESLVSAFAPVEVFDGLFIRNAISHARLLADFDALTDFSHRLITVAEDFWLRFEGGATKEKKASMEKDGEAETSDGASALTGNNFSTSVLRAIRVDLALICVPLSTNCQTTEGVDELAHRMAGHRAQELGIWVHSNPETSDIYGSRSVLLFKHLFDLLNGELFDGSILECVLAEDALQLPYHLRPLSVRAIAARHLALREVFAYGQDSLRPCLIVIERKSLDEVRKISQSRAYERRCVTYTLQNSDFSQYRGGKGVPKSRFLLPCSDSSTKVSFKSLLPPDPVGIATVVVFRKLYLSREQACGEVSGAFSEKQNNTKKPFVLHVVEECCQYGRVLSYHVHEDLFPLPEGTPKASEERGAVTENTMEPNIQEYKAVFPDAQQPVLSLFVEFASADSAVEAARHFAQRFAIEALQRPQSQAQWPQVRLFRNNVYYLGVEQDEATTSESCERPADADSDDNFFEDLLRESLLGDNTQ